MNKQQYINEEELYQQIMAELEPGAAEYDRMMASGEAPAKKAKVIPLRNRWYAVAVCFIGLLIVGGAYMLNTGSEPQIADVKPTVTPKQVESQIAHAIDNNVGTVSFVETHNAPKRKALPKVAKEEGDYVYVCQEIEITPDDLLSYLGPIKNIISKKGEDRVGAVNGLAYSELGGDLLPIEACRYKGKGELKLTGKLGDVIKESCEIAYTAVKSVLSADNIYKDLVGSLDQYNIHIHFPDGSTPKDGPSAGIAICTVLYSIITGRSVRSDFALTGEISLLGRVLPIGGLKEKLQGAINSGVYEIILPKDNENDLEKVPEAIKKQLTFHFVDSLTEVLSLVIKN